MRYESDDDSPAQEGTFVIRRIEELGDSDLDHRDNSDHSELDTPGVDPRGLAVYM